MVTIRNNSIELEDGDTISVDGTELTFRSSGELEFPDGETAISLSDIDGADIAPNSISFADSITDAEGNTLSKLSADSIGAVGSSQFNQVVQNLARIRFEIGLSQLEYRSGEYDAFIDSARGDSFVDVTVSNEKLVLDSGVSSGSVEYQNQSFEFTPDTAVLSVDEFTDTNQWEFVILDENGDTQLIDSTEEDLLIDLDTSTRNFEFTMSLSRTDTESVELNDWALFLNGSPGAYYDASITETAEQ
jgi:hypothetical protein